MTTRSLLTILLLLLTLTGTLRGQEAGAERTDAPPAVRSQQGRDVPLRDQLRRRIEAAPDQGSVPVGGAVLRADAALSVFYERRAYRPAWVTGEGPRPIAEALLNELHAADQEGLQPGDYHAEQIATGLRNAPASTPQTEELVDLELLLTDAFLTLGAHLLRGRVDPETFDADWLASPRTSDLPGHLESAVASGDMASALANLLPPQPGYQALRDALSRYHRIASDGGWPAVGEGPRLEPGDRNGRVPALRRRLAVTGDFPDDAAATDPADPELYDEPLAEAVRIFQARHGLSTDAIVGPATLAALDTPVGMRVFRGWGVDAEEVDPSTVDWSEVSARSFPYRLRQDPGPVNALGRIKFMFPNKFSVYLHDTPARDLYARSARDFSSGCIRVERARDLAVWLLGEGDRSADRLESGWSAPDERTISLPSPVPIHLLYWTAWAEEDGTVHFRNDIYGRDGRLAAALAEVPSSGVPR